MSLSKLPNELIAHIGSFLDYKDNQKFALVKKRFHAVLASDRLDKPEIHILRFDKGDKASENDSVNVLAFLHEDSDYIELETLKDQRISGSDTPKILNIINKFRAIDTLQMQGILLHDHAGFDLIRTKMRHLFVKDCGLWMARDTFVNFCKRFKLITFEAIYTDASFVNDAFFNDLIRNGTTILFDFGVRLETHAKLEVDVTDSTLDALTATKTPEELSLETLVTKLSFPRVLKMCENALKSDINEVYYNFGFLTKDQYPAVMKFVNEDFEDWTARMKLPLTIETNDLSYWREESDQFTEFLIQYSNYKGVDMSFFFSFDKPAVLIEQENEMDIDDDNSDEDRELQMRMKKCLLMMMTTSLESLKLFKL